MSAGFDNHVCLVKRSLFLLWATFLNEAMPGDTPSDLHSIVNNVMSPHDALAVSGSSVFEVLWRDVFCRLGRPCKHACWCGFAVKLKWSPNVEVRVLFDRTLSVQTGS